MDIPGQDRVEASDLPADTETIAAKSLAEEVNPDHEAVRELFGSLKHSLKEFWGKLSPSTRKTYLAVGIGASALALLWGGARLAQTETDIDDGILTDYENLEDEIVAEEPTEELASETPTPPTSEVFDIDNVLPYEHYARSTEAENYVKTLILNNRIVNRDSMPLSDRVSEAVRGVVLTDIETDQGKIFIRLENPINVKLSDPTGSHDFLLAYAAWHPPSQRMIYIMSGYLDGKVHTRYDVGFGFWAFEGDLYTPQIISVTPSKFSEDSLSVIDDTAWQARGRFNGDNPPPELTSQARIFTDHAEAIKGLGTTYNIRVESQFLFRDRETIEGIKANQSSSTPKANPR